MRVTENKQQTWRCHANWDAIHREYRAGLLSLREIAVEYCVSHTAIRKRAARDGWERDLAARIGARAQALVSKAEVSNEVSTELAVGDEVIVEANAQAVVQIRLLHRQEIARARTLAMALLDDLQTISENPSLMERLAMIVAENEGPDPKQTNQRIATVRKAFDFSSRAGMLKLLVETLSKLVALEREAYGLDTEPDSIKSKAESQLAEVLRQLTA